MLRKRLITNLVLCLVLCTVSTTVYGQYRFYRWSTDNGLPQNGVRGIAQTHDGYLWVSTFDGLARFDGLKFAAFNKGNTPGILNNRFIGVFVDKKGVLFARVEDGSLTIYENGEFSTLTAEQVPGDLITFITSDENGTTLFQTKNIKEDARNWYEYKDGGFVFRNSYTKEEFNQQRKYTGRSGRRWTIERDKTTEFFNGQTTVYPLDLSGSELEVALFEDSSGSLWVGDKQVYNLYKGNIRQFDETDGLVPIVSYHSFSEESDGSIWFASSGGPSGGIGLVQFRNDKFTFWNDISGLTSDIFAVYQIDNSDKLFLATNEGLFSRRREVIKAFDTDVKDHKIEAYPIFQDRDGMIWVGTGKGLYTLENGKYTQVSFKMPKSEKHRRYWDNPNISVQSLWQDEEGQMWIGAYGTAFIAKDGIAREIEAASGLSIFAITPDSNGNVWLATNDGVLQFKDGQFIKKYTMDDGLAGNFISVIFEDSQRRVWFGGKGGLVKMQSGKIVPLPSSEGMPTGNVRTIYEDANGTLWIGTYDEGLARYKDEKFFSVKKKDGLFSDGAFAIREDRGGHFWISSNQGIYRVERRQLNDFADGKIHELTSVGYGKDDGMVSVECNGGRQPSSITDSDGFFWFPTQQGIVRIDPSAERHENTPLHLVVESATIEHNQADIKNSLTIPAGERNVEITYTAINFDKPEQTKFKYQLEGYDKDWVMAGTRRSALYSHIPPGNYVFRVKAAGGDGIWTESSAELKIEALPFFYQTNLFYLSLALGVIVAGFSGWQYSIYGLKRRERKLTKQVAERTAELKAANEELILLANLDDLTKIRNRRYFESYLHNEWNRSIRSKEKISIILLDVDYFKLYNDTYGHQAGDACLKVIAKTVSESVNRPGDLVARFGGEEFIVGLGGTDEAGAVRIAKNILSRINALQIPHATSMVESTVTVSLGIATWLPQEGDLDTELIRKADQALYKAKENGRNCFYLLTEADDESVLNQKIVL